jgi:hypothetical protein
VDDPVAFALGSNFALAPCMRIARSFALVFSSMSALVVVACSGDGSSFPNGDGSGNGSGKDGGAVVFGTADSGSGSGDLSQCATSTATPNPVPVSLVFIFDKSGSMDDDSKWTSCQSGLTSFFADKGSSGLSASLQFFPLSNECGVGGYAAPAVAMRALPDSTTFATAMSANQPGGNTPTLPALTGAIQYAQSVQSANPGAKVAVVLVTDGEPNDCNSTVNAVANEAATAAATIPTFVIGVGNTGNLDAIAKAGGTTAATIVSTQNPQQTSQDFETALNAIRGITLACEYEIPAPPQGETFDENKVNVVYTPQNGGPQTLAYDQDCTNGTGWHYDDPQNPQKIILCASTCTSVQQQSGTIKIVTGCDTNGVVPH